MTDRSNSVVLLFSTSFPICRFLCHKSILWPEELQTLFPKYSHILKNWQPVLGVVNYLPLNVSFKIHILIHMSNTSNAVVHELDKWQNKLNTSARKPWESEFHKTTVVVFYNISIYRYASLVLYSLLIIIKQERFF